MKSTVGYISHFCVNHILLHETNVKAIIRITSELQNVWEIENTTELY